MLPFCDKYYFCSAVLFLTVLLISPQESKAQSVLGFGLNYNHPLDELTDLDHKGTFGGHIFTALELRRFPRLPVYSVSALRVHGRTQANDGIDLEWIEGEFTDTDLDARTNFIELETGLRLQPFHKSNPLKAFVDLSVSGLYNWNNISYNYLLDGAEESTGGSSKLSSNWEFGLVKSFGVSYSFYEAALELKMRHVRYSPARLIEYEDFYFINEREAIYDTELIRPEQLSFELSVYFFLQ